MEETFWPNGNIKSRKYLNADNYLHNEHVPAIEKWYENGQLMDQEYYINGQRHNERGPAIQRWSENGQLWFQGYFIKCRLHNEQGPALQSWYENGKVFKQEYWIEGKELTETKFKSMIPSVKSASKS